MANKMKIEVEKFSKTEAIKILFFTVHDCTCKINGCDCFISFKKGFEAGINEGQDRVNHVIIDATVEIRKSDWIKKGRNEALEDVIEIIKKCNLHVPEHNQLIEKIQSFKQKGAEKK